MFNVFQMVVTACFVLNRLNVTSISFKHDDLVYLHLRVRNRERGELSEWHNFHLFVFSSECSEVSGGSRASEYDYTEFGTKYLKIFFLETS